MITFEMWILIQGFLFYDQEKEYICIHLNGNLQLNLFHPISSYLHV